MIQFSKSRVYVILLAHELAHNWGVDQHDNEVNDPDYPNCVPGEAQGGSYIMHSSVSKKFNSNFYKFSRCSRRDIADFLFRVGHTCLLPAHVTSDMCGDGIVTPDEECDDGFLTRRFPGGAKRCCTDRCRLAADVTCSPSSSTCCTPRCTVAPRGQECRSAAIGSCHEKAFCDRR